MDLSNQEIRFNILISNIQQILSQTNEITGNISKLSQQKSTKTVMQQIGEDTSKATQNSKEYNRVLEEELKIRRQLQQNIDNAKSKQNLDANKRYWSDEEASLKRRSDLIRSQMEAQQKQTNEYNRYLQQEAKAVDYANRQEAIQQSYQQSYYERAKAAKEAATYESKLSQLRQQGMKAYMSGDTAGFAKYKKEFDDLNLRMVKFNKEWGVWNRGFYSMGQSVDYFFAKLRYRLAA